MDAVTSLLIVALLGYAGHRWGDRMTRFMEDHTRRYW